MQIHEHWLAIAQDDLTSANILAESSLITSLFHAQQCAEKALKAYLVLERGLTIKTHDLVRLVDLCMVRNDRFETLRLIAIILTPYETAGRYPNNTFIQPTPEEMLGLIQQSAAVFAFVIEQLKKKMLNDN